LRSASCGVPKLLVPTVEMPIAKHAFGIVIGQKA
jgi:hypothetical protein